MEKEYGRMRKGERKEVREINKFLRYTYRHCSWFGCRNEAIGRELYKLGDGQRVWFYWCEKHKKEVSNENDISSKENRTV